MTDKISRKKEVKKRIKETRNQFWEQKCIELENKIKYEEKQDQV